MAITVPTVVTESVKATPIRAPMQSGRGVEVGGLVQGLDVAAQAMATANKELSQIRLTEAENEVIARWNARLFTDEDAYYKLGGKDAVDALDPRMSELQEIQNEVIGRLKTGAEKRILSEALAGRHQTTRAKMSMKGWDERQAWDRATNVAGIKTQLESAANDPSPENLRVTAARIAEMADAIATIDDMPREARDRAVRESVSGMFRGAIESVIADDPFRAQAMFDRYEKDIIANDQKELTKQLKEVTLASEARGLVQKAVSQSDSLDDQLNFIDKAYGKNPTPRQLELQERARAKALIRNNAVSTAENKARSENFGFLGAEVMNGVELDVLKANYPERFETEALTPEMRAWLDRNGSGQMQEPKQNWALWTSINQEAKTNPKRFADSEIAKNPMLVREFLDDRHYNDLLALAADAENLSRSSKSKFTSSMSSKLVKAANNNGIKVKDDDYAVLEGYVQERVDAYIEEHPQSEPPPGSVFDKFVNEALVETKLPLNGGGGDEMFETVTIAGVPMLRMKVGPASRSLWNKLFDGRTTKRGFEVQIGDVPPEMRERIVRNLIERNKAAGDPRPEPNENDITSEFVRILTYFEEEETGEQIPAEFPTLLELIKQYNAGS